MLYLVDLESVETRYTSEWKQYLPEQLLANTDHGVFVIDGPNDIAACTTPGAFLNFSGTNVYKSVQVQKIAELFTNNEIKAGDHFLFCDAWHPGIINLKYMSELLSVPITIHAIWHAGSYDPQDFLGRVIGDAPWVRHTEKAFFDIVDHNYFATDFHIKLFLENLLDLDVRTGRIRYMPSGKITRSGLPMEYLYDRDVIKPGIKRDLILFPHRIASEKQVAIFKDLAEAMPEYDWVICQEEYLSKEEYHTLLGEAKIVFSANLQETLGISCYEILKAGGMPLVPDRLSYTEMYDEAFVYPSEWTTDMGSYLLYREFLIETVYSMMDNYESHLGRIDSNLKYLNENFFSGTNIYNNMKN